MVNNIREVAQAVIRMDEHLRNDLLKNQEGRLWENTNQVDRRKRGDKFSLTEHIRAMILSMLSSERGWAAIDENMERINEIFFGYAAERILSTPPEHFENEIKRISCGNRQIKFQMQALKGNIEKLKEFEAKAGSVDDYYNQLIGNDVSVKKLVRSLSDHNSKNKLARLEVPLVSEYLRHVGYDLPKPDRHICRVLGSKVLACSNKEVATVFEVFDIIAEIAVATNKSAAEVDYILWSYCADGYGAICTVKNPKCDKCVAKEICSKYK
jgi:endonuclease III